MQICPKCGLINPSGVLQCDCGWRFGDHENEEGKPKRAFWTSHDVKPRVNKSLASCSLLVICLFSIAIYCFYKAYSIYHEPIVRIGSKYGVRVISLATLTDRDVIAYGNLDRNMQRNFIRQADSNRSKYYSYLAIGIVLLILAGWRSAYLFSGGSGDHHQPQRS